MSTDMSHVYNLKTCTPGVPCEAGPLTDNRWWCTFSYYFCGKANTTLPTSHFYEEELVGSKIAQDEILAEDVTKFYYYKTILQVINLCH